MYNTKKAKAQDEDKDDASYKVKNTFLEFTIPSDHGNNTHKRRSRSDMTSMQDPRLSPLVMAKKSPHCSPLLRPTDEKLQAVPIDEVNFELLEESAFDAAGSDTRYDAAASGSFSGPGELVAQSMAGGGREEPAYVVPTTPSPFLHSAFPPAAMVPPFGTYGYGIDMGLPPAFAEGEEGAEGAVQFDMQGVEGQFMQGMSFLPPEMYDPSAWTTDADGNFIPAEGCGYGWPGWPPVATDGEGGAFAADSQMAQEMALGLLDANGNDTQDVDPGSPAALAAAAESAKAAADKDAAAEKKARDREEKDGRRGKGRNRDQREDERPERGGRGDRDQADAPSRREEHLPWDEHQKVIKDRRGDRDQGGAAADQGDLPANYTTVMLRNIPNKYTREMLIKQLSVEFYGLFDFMYLPIDFKNKCNVGYAFINFRTTEACKDFISKFHGVDVRKCLPGLNSKKIVEVTPARVQGLSENVRRLRNSPVMNQLVDHPEWMPLLFGKNGDEEIFPMPESTLPPVKPRGRNREAKNEG